MATLIATLLTGQLFAAAAAAAAAPPERSGGTDEASLASNLWKGVKEMTGLGFRYADGTAFKVEIEGVTQGLRISGDDLVSTITDITGSMGGTVNALTMTQSNSIVIDFPSTGLTEDAIRVRGGEVDARLTSLTTETGFDWTPRSDSYAQCLVFRTINRESSCVQLRVVQELTGSITTGRTVCGSITQAMAYDVVWDGDGVPQFGGFVRTEDFDGTGQLHITNRDCQSWIYGVMPGDNITLQGPQTARITVVGVTTGNQGQRTLADIEFQGVLRNGLTIEGRGQARLSRGSTDGLQVRGIASGDVRFTAVVSNAGQSISINGRGDIELAEMTLTGDAFAASGIMDFIPSETGGSSND